MSTLRSAPWLAPVARTTLAALHVALYVQLLSAGAAVFVAPHWWAWHAVTFHLLLGLAGVLTAITWLGRFGRGVFLPALITTILLLALSATTSVRGTSVAWLGALHPVIGVTLIALTVAVGRNLGPAIAARREPRDSSGGARATAATDGAEQPAPPTTTAPARTAATHSALLLAVASTIALDPLHGQVLPTVNALPAVAPHAAPPGARDPYEPFHTVQDAMRRARAQAASSQIARRSARIADRVGALAVVPLLPFVSADASTTRQTLNLATFGFPGPGTLTDPFTVYAAGIRAQQTLLDLSSWRRAGAQRDSARAALADAVATEEGAAALGATRYYQWIAADAAHRGRLADSALAAEILREALARRATGAGTDLDVTRAQLGVAGARARLADARGTQQQARLDFALAVAMPLDLAATLATLPDSLPAPDDDPLAAALRATIPDALTAMTSVGRDHTDRSLHRVHHAVELALSRRPELRAARDRLRAAGALRTAGLLEWVPRVSAFGEYQATGINTQVLPTVYRVGVVASVPLLDGFARQQRMAIDGERAHIVRLVEDDVRHRIEREVRGAIVELGSAAEAARVGEEARRLADAELQQARRRLAAGAASTIETTRALSGVAAARDESIRMRLRYHLARLEWHRATATLDALR
jgi:outer membrane protein TolC